MISRFVDEMRLSSEVIEAIEAVEAVEAVEATEATEVIEAAEVLRPGKSLLRTSGSSRHLNSAIFMF
jgi:hypothetical protein